MLPTQRASDLSNTSFSSDSSPLPSRGSVDVAPVAPVAPKNAHAAQNDSLPAGAKPVESVFPGEPLNQDIRAQYQATNALPLPWQKMDLPPPCERSDLPDIPRLLEEAGSNGAANVPATFAAALCGTLGWASVTDASNGKTVIVQYPVDLKTQTVLNWTPIAYINSIGDMVKETPPPDILAMIKPQPRVGMFVFHTDCFFLTRLVFVVSGHE